MKTVLLVSVFALACALPARAESFRALADAVLSSGALSGASVGAMFVSLDDGTTVYSKNPDLPLRPASDAKLATSIGALERLKPDFRFRTSFLIKKKERGRRSVSVLVWKGSGDPSISGRGRSSMHELFDAWGSSLTALGIETVGRLVLDERLFEGPAVAPSWPANELTYWYAAETSPISFNDNCTDLRFSPGVKVGDRARIVLEPDFGYIKAINRTTTGSPGSRFTVDFRREPGTNVVTFFGSLGATDAAHTDYVAVHDPALFAADTLRRTWEKTGPRVLARAVSWKKSGLKDDELAEVLAAESEPLSELLKVVDKNSQNFYAEQLLKTLGREAEGRGTAEAGLSEVRRVLEKASLAESEHHLVDGSGLSEDNLLTAAGLIKILRFMRASPYFPVYFDALAIPGVDKSARDRMKGEPLAGAMRLKRGTVAHARNLAGYLRTGSGRLYAFALLVNGTGLDRAAVDAAQDRLCIAAARGLP